MAAPIGSDLYRPPAYNPGASPAQASQNYWNDPLSQNIRNTAAQNQWYAAIAHNAALANWYKAAAAQTAAAPTPAPSLSGGGSSGGTGSGGVSGGVVMPNIGGLQAGINQQFDQRVALLKQLLGTAHAGIGAVGNQVNSQLGGLAKDSSAEGKRIAADIVAQYAAQRHTAGVDQAALLADLQRQGANVGVLQATNAQQNLNLKGEQGRQSALDQRLQQVLGSSMANRQAGAVAATGGFQQQLDTKGALLQQGVEQQRFQALQALQQQLAAASLAAARSGGGGGRRGGGGRSSRSAKAPNPFQYFSSKEALANLLTPAAAAQLTLADERNAGFRGGGTAVYGPNQGPGVGSSLDWLGNWYTDQLNSGKLTPAQAYQHYQQYDTSKYGSGAANVIQNLIATAEQNQNRARSTTAAHKSLLQMIANM